MMARTTASSGSVPKPVGRRGVAGVGGRAPVLWPGASTRATVSVA